MVMSIIRYGAAVWGHIEFTCIEAVHNRMCRYFLGVNKYTPNAAVRGDMGVKVPWQHQNIEIARQWCKFSNMSDTRLNKQIFLWAKNGNSKNWVKKTKELLHQCDLHDYVDMDGIEKSTFLQELNGKLEILYSESWLGLQHYKK